MISSERTASSDSLRGAQRPRLSHIPEYVSTSGDEAIALAQLAGLELDDWQQYVLRHSLGERSDGKWAAPTVGLVVGRQNGKNAILEARELAGLFLLGERTIIHSAHEQATASEQFDRLLYRIRNTPELWALVDRAIRGKGSEAIVLETGQRILFKPRTGAAGLGFTVDALIFDEAHILTEMSRSALIPTISARSITGNTQTWYTASAGDQENPRHQPLVLARVRESGLKGVAGIAWFEWSAAGEDPSRVGDVIRADPEVWAQANPGMGVRISTAAIEHERTVGMGPREFAVERLGIGDWPDTSDDAGRMISQEAWVDCAEHDPANRIATAQTFAVDVNPDRTWATIAVAGQRADELYQVAIVDHKRGTDWVVDRLAALLRQDSKARVVIDARSPADNLIADIEKARLGSRVLRASTEDYGNACAGFFDAVDHRSVRYPSPQPELDDALASGRAKTMGDRWKWARKSATSSDITPLVAVTLALWGAQNKPARPRIYSFAELERLEQQNAAKLAEGEGGPHDPPASQRL